MKGVDGVLQIIIEGIKRAESDCIKYVLSMHLKREPTDEDAKRCTRYQREGGFDRYFLAFDGEILGEIIKDETAVRFEPLSPE